MPHKKIFKGAKSAVKTATTPIGRFVSQAAREIESGASTVFKPFRDVTKAIKPKKRPGRQ